MKRTWKKVLAWTLAISVVLPGGIGTVGAQETTSFQKVSGWNETLYAEWEDSNAVNARIRYRLSGDGEYQELEEEYGILVRQTKESLGRVDIPGLKPGKYDIQVETSEGVCYERTEIPVYAYDRSGYAHYNYTEGIGAYEDDGTLKENAIVLHVTNENKDTVTIPGYESYGTGIGYLLNGNSELMEKLASDGHALSVRFVGQVEAPEGLTAHNSTENGGAVGDNGNMAVIKRSKNVTLEGIGADAVIEGWGFCFFVGEGYANYESYEVRNLTFRNYPEDALGFQGAMSDGELTAPIERVWVHNNTFYSGYCAEPAEEDKADGDGSCDFKRGQYYTMAYNHYSGCHKTNLLGGGDSNLQYHITFHHNFYEDCSSRSPLGRQGNIHIYNSYFKGNTSTTVDARADAIIFSEANYYEACKNPVKVDAEGTTVKSYQDVFENCTKTNAATVVASRDEEVTGNNKYLGFDTDATVFYYDSANQCSEVAYLTDADQAKEDCLKFSGVMKETEDGSAPAPELTPATTPGESGSPVPEESAGVTPETTASALPTQPAGERPGETVSPLPEATVSTSPSAVATGSAMPEKTFRPGLGYRDIETEGGLHLLEKIEVTVPKQYQKGDRIKAGKLIYKVTKVNKNRKGKVKVLKPAKKNLKKIKIPAKIKKGKQTFQVTGIGKKAFSGYKKLKKIYLPSKKMYRYVKSKRKTIALPKKCKIYLKK